MNYYNSDKRMIDAVSKEKDERANVSLTEKSLIEQNEDDSAAGLVQCLLSAIVLAIIIYFLIMELGMWQFGGMDGSAAVQGGYRVYLGQKPYEDFQAVINPSYMIIPGWSFMIMGVKWKSLVYLAAFYSSITFVLHVYLMNTLGVRLFLANFLSFSLQTMTLIPVAWWTYNQTAMVSSMSYVLILLVWIRQSNSWFNSLLLIVSIVILSWEKQNTAGFALVIASSIMLYSASHRWRYLTCIGISVVLSVSLLYLNHVNPLEMLKSYFSSKGRLNHQMILSNMYPSHDEWNTTYILLPFLFCILCCGIARFMHARRKKLQGTGNVPLSMLILLTGFLTGIVSWMTNNELQVVSLSLSGICLILMMLINTKGYSEKQIQFLVENKQELYAEIPRKIFFCLSLIFWAGLCLYSLGNAFTRYRIEGIGKYSFYEPEVSETIQDGRFFNGLHTGKRLVNLIQQMDVLIHNVPPELKKNHGLFFGPRIEFSYALYDVTPPRGLSLWWMGTGEASKEMLEKSTQAFKENQFQYCIFLRQDFTYMNVEVINYLKENYHYFELGDLSLLVRNTKPREEYLEFFNKIYNPGK